MTYVSPDGGDGARIYDISGFDEPPPRFARLTDRLPYIPITAWPFLIVAIAVAVLRAQDLWTWGWGSMSTAYVAAAVLGTLMPVALVIGCPRVWRSAPVILIGVVAWVWITQALGLVSQAVHALEPESLPDEFIPYTLGVAQDLVAIPALAGPALIAYGLLKRRRTETTWPRAMVVAAIVIAAAWGLSNARGMLDVYGSINSGPDGIPAGLTKREIVQAIAVLLRPVEILGLAAVAWTSLSAIRAGEVHRRFWALAFAGSTVLFCLDVYSNVVWTMLYGGSAPSDFAIAVFSSVSDIIGGGYLLAYAALVAAFMIGLPPDPLDLGDVVTSE